MIKLKDEIDSLEGQLDEAKTSKERELEGLRKTKKQVLLLQEQINDQKKREAELPFQNALGCGNFLKASPG